MGELLDAGADIVVRAGWKNARWLGPEGKPIDLLAVLRKGTTRGLIDQPIWIARKVGAPLALRLVAIKKLPQAAEAARRKARREAAKGRHQISKGTLAAAEWVILVTSVAPRTFTTANVLALYRLRWRIDIDQAWQLSELCEGRGRSGLIWRRQTPPWERGSADCLQGCDRRVVGMDEDGMTGAHSYKAAA